MAKAMIDRVEFRTTVKQVLKELEAAGVWDKPAGLACLNKIHSLMMMAKRPQYMMMLHDNKPLIVIYHRGSLGVISNYDTYAYCGCV